MKRTLVATVLALALAASAGRADEPRYFETATVRARPIGQSTASVTVMDREAIEALDVQTVGELLRQLVGVDVTGDGARAERSAAQIRGGDPNFTAVLMDGVMLNNPTDTLGGSVDLHSLPIDLVERIEVVRGPVSSLYGSTGLSGAIQIITRRAASPGSRHASLDFGSSDVARASASWSGAGERRDFMVGLVAEQESERIGKDDFGQVSVVGNARFGDDRSELLLNGRIATREVDDYPESSGGPLLGDGAVRVSTHDEAALGLRWRFGAGDDRSELYASIYRQELDRDSPGVPTGPTGQFVPPSRETTRYTRIRTGLAAPPYRTDSTVVSTGLEIDHEIGDNDASLLVPFLGPTPASYDVERTTGAAYLEITTERGPWLLEAGARLDLPEGVDAELSPRLGARWRASGGRDSLRASVGRAFKLPSFFALASPGLLGGNPDLVPETSTSADLAYERELEAIGGRISIGLFHQEFDELIDFDFATFKLLNLDQVTARGAELAFECRPVDGLVLSTVVTRQDLDVDLPQRPEWYGAFRASWRFAGDFVASVDVQGVGERLDTQIPAGFPTMIDGYLVAGAGFSWDVSPHWQIRATADNLLDEDYRTQLGFPGPETSVRVGARFRSN